MKKIMAIACMAFIVNVQAQTWVNIPDANFATYLQGLIPAAMSGNQLNTSSPLVTTATHSINVYFSDIADLTGVQYFSSLTHLDCSYNYSLTALPVLPASLMYLNCINTALSSLSALPASLDTLLCAGTPITSLPALPASLTYLNCTGNFLTTLPALPASLTELYCEGGSLTSLPTLPASLKVLVCDSNRISCFPTFPNSLTTVAIGSGNPYTCLPNYVLPAMNSYTNTPLCAAGNTNGCTVSTAGIEQYKESSKANIYPNPNKGSFVIETNRDEKQTMQLYDANGRLVFSQTINGKTHIDAGSLNEGVYNISIISNEGVVNKRLVIVK